MLPTDLPLESMSLWRSLVDIVLVAVIVYQLLLLLKGSRSGAVLLAVAVLFGMFYVSQDDMFDLPTLNWLLDRFISSIVVLLVVLFQDDIRRALSGAMRAPLLFSGSDRASSAVLEEVLRATAVLSQRGIGALMVIEQEADLDRYIEHGVRIDSKVSWQLLMSLFIPSHMNPTHDGAIIIQKGRITSAACFLPLAYGDDIPSNLGSRHRAALGLADDTDAVVVVVSEESGSCALAHMGQIDLGLKPSDLRERFGTLFGDREVRPQAWRKRWQRRVVHQPVTTDATRTTRDQTTTDPGASLRPTARVPTQMELDVNATRSLAAHSRPSGETEIEMIEDEGAPPEPALEPIVTASRETLTVVPDPDLIDEAVAASPLANDTGGDDDSQKEAL